VGTVGAEDASSRLWDCGDDVEIEIEMRVRARGSLAKALQYTAGHRAFIQNGEKHKTRLQSL
jgi:hypothetical protein